MARRFVLAISIIRSVSSIVRQPITLNSDPGIGKTNAFEPVAKIQIS